MFKARSVVNMLDCDLRGVLAGDNDLGDPDLRVVDVPSFMKLEETLPITLPSLDDVTFRLYSSLDWGRSGFRLGSPGISG